MAFRTATSRRAGAGILGTLAVLLAAALATSQPDPVLAATPVRDAAPVAGGLPTVVRYGTPGFPKTAESWPANRGNLFAGGAGGTGKLVQQTSVTPNARYDIAGWLGGTRPAPRNSPFSSRAQAGEFSLRPRSGRPGNRRSRCSITGGRPARFPRARRGPG